jgi:hypothetical protein
MPKRAGSATYARLTGHASAPISHSDTVLARG